MRIFLIGYRCCGKTLVGKLLSEKTGKVFLDTDILLEKGEGSTITQIVEKKGWDEFRKLEASYLKESIKKDIYSIISTGGGIIEKEENILEMRENGRIIWLRASVETIMDRLEKDSKTKSLRPSLTNEDTIKEVGAVLRRREALYEKASDFSIETDSMSPDKIVDEIIKKLEVS